LARDLRDDIGIGGAPHADGKESNVHASSLVAGDMAIRTISRQLLVARFYPRVQVLKNSKKGVRSSSQ
jgi:hypothetical protein